jgi:ABC-2 type transport system permease protein
MVAAQAAMELKLLLRNGEQVLLTLVIPVGVLVVFTRVPFVDITGSRVGFFVPGVLALAVMSAAFTGQAIGTGFEREYGVLKRLGATALPRWSLLTGKTLAVLAVEAIQIGVLCAVGVGLGWAPRGDAGWVVLVVVLGTAAFSGLALLMAGTLRAMTTLAAANLAWFVLLALGGILFPLSELGPGSGWLTDVLPSAALADGLRAVLAHGAALPAHDAATLAGWAIAALAAASVTFRWE